MSYVGNVPTTAAFPFDQFSGDGSTTAFTLSYAPAGTTSIIVSISGVVQNPNTYSVSGTTLTFTPAPPTGTNNIAVLYLGLPVVATLSPGNTAYFSSSVFTATSGQTVFTPSGTYQTGFINVIRNGAQLAPANYTATNGTTVTLANACTAGDIVVIEVFNLTSIAGALPATGGAVTGATTFNSTVQVNGANVSGFTGFKNRIINPGMVINQRGFTSTTTEGYTVDRWRFERFISSGTFTCTTSTDAPAGFTSSLQITTTTAASSITGVEYVQYTQFIEGFNTSDFQYGTATASTVTVSFWVKASQTGLYSANIGNSAGSYAFAGTFTVIASGVWEYKTLTVTGALAGTWLTNNSVGVGLRIGVAYGSTFTTGAIANAWKSGTGFEGMIAAPTNNMATTTGAYIRLTGVQLERGSNATSYEFRSYGQELALCQRYYYRISPAASSKFLAQGNCFGTTQVGGSSVFPVIMRTAPTALEQSGTATHYAVLNSVGSTVVCNAVPVFNVLTTTDAAYLSVNVASGVAAGDSSVIITNNTAAYLGWSAEL